jgi:hypothetical protein
MVIWAADVFHSVRTGADIYSVRLFSSGPAVNKLFLKKVFKEYDGVTEAHALSGSYE